MKKIISMILVLVMTLSLVACGTNNSSSGQQKDAKDTIKIRIAAQYGDDHPQSKSIHYFKEQLESKSNEFKVEVYTNNMLGAAEVWQDMLLEGSVEMAFPGGNIANYYPMASVTECPFLFTTWDEAKYIFNETEICDEMNAAMPGEIGLRSLGSTPIGFRVTTSNKKLTSPADYQGLRLRTPNINYCVWLAEALGANVISMNMAELFTALEQGAVDAQENPYSTIVANSLYEVQKYIYDSKHMFTTHFWYTNEKWWQGLSAEQQEMIQECVDAASDYAWEMAINSEKEYIAQLEEYGVEVVYPTDEQRQEMRAMQGETWKKFYEAYPGSQEYVEKIQKALAER